MDMCTFRTCGQCCLFRIWVVGSKIALGLHVPDTWSVFSVPYVGDGINIVIGLYVLDMWSVLFVLICRLWDLLVIAMYHTGHVTDII